MSPTVTVLIPNYNGSLYLAHCLDSLFSQTNQNFLCHFLDDGSTDRSLEIAQQYQPLIPAMTVHAFPRGGIAANWNRGMRLVKTKYFAILHCDDSYAPDYLRTMVDLMDSHPQSGIGHCAVQAIDSESKAFFSFVEFYKNSVFLPREKFERELKNEFSLLLKGNFINCPSVIYRTEAAKNIGEFDESLVQTLDWSYWFRTLLAGYKICATNRKLYYYRRHSNNVTLQNAENLTRYREELQCLRSAHGAAQFACYVKEEISYVGLQQILLVDFSAALRQGKREFSKKLIEFLRVEIKAKPYVIYALRGLLAIGKAGGMILYLLIWIAVFFTAAKKMIMRAVFSK